MYGIVKNVWPVPRFEQNLAPLGVKVMLATGDILQSSHDYQNKKKCKDLFRSFYNSYFTGKSFKRRSRRTDIRGSLGTPDQSF